MDTYIRLSLPGESTNGIHPTYLITQSDSSNVSEEPIGFVQSTWLTNEIRPIYMIYQSHSSFVASNCDSYIL
jgi:hypothetical protein